MLRYLVEVVPKGNLAGDQFMGQVVILLFQPHTGLLETTVLPLDKHTYTQLDIV